MKKRCTTFLISMVMFLLFSVESFAYVSPDYIMTGWIPTQSEENASWTLDSEDKHSGVVSAAVNVGLNGNVKIYQNVTGLTPLTEYEFSFYSKAENAENFKIVRDVLFQVDARADGSANYNWSKKTITFTTGKNAKSASFQFVIKNTQAKMSNVWIDECSLCEKGAGDAKNLLLNSGFDDDVDTTIPAAITELAAVTDDASCTITWKDSISEDFVGVNVYCDKQYIETVNKGIEKYILENLTNEKQYTYSFTAIDDWKNESLPEEIKFIPKAPREAPKVIANDEENIISGIDNTMEYQIDNGEWTTYSEDTIINLSGCHIVNVRYAKTDELAEGKTAVIIFYTNEEKVDSNLSANVENKIGKITINGMATDDTVTVLVQNFGSDEYENIVYVREIEVQDSKFQKVFNMPTNATRDKYQITVNLGNFEDTLILEYTYVPQKDIEQFISELIAVDEEQIKIMLIDKKNSDIYSTIGINPQDFYKISDLSPLATAIKSDKTPTIETFTKHIGMFTAFGMIKSVEKKAEVLEILNHYGDEYIGLVFEKKAWKDVTDNVLKEWICDNFANKDIKSKNEVDNLYELANIYYQINQGSYALMEKLIRQYSNQLEITNNSAYNKFVSMTQTQKADILKEVKLAQDKYRDNKTFISELESAVANIKEESSNVDGGGNSRPDKDNKTPSGIPTSVSDKTQIKEEPKKIFTDLDDAEWAKEAIEALYKIGVVSGISDGCFAPNQAVTREQIAKMMTDAFELSLGDMPEEFIDVTEESWSYPYIMIMKSNGIIAGYEDGSFRPSDKITREDLAVIICRTCELAEIELNNTKTDNDIVDKEQISPYAVESVLQLYSAEILNGTGAGFISPKGTATRAMAAKLIYSIIKEAK